MPVSGLAVVAVLVASAFSAGLSAVAARSARRRGGDPWWGGGVAVGLGYVVAHLGVLTPSFPPVDVTDRLPIIAVIASAVAVALAWARGALWARLAGALGLSGVVLGVLLEPIFRAGEFPRETIVQLAAVVGLTVLALVNVALLDRPTGRLELGVALAVLAAGGGVVLLLGHSAVLFQLAGIVAVVLSAGLLGARGWPLGGGVLVGSSLLAALVVEGSVYASLPTIPAVLLAAAPALLWLTRLGPLARLGSKSRVALAAALMTIPVAIALGLMVTSMSFDGY